MEILQGLPERDTETGGDQCCWENGAGRLARPRVTPDLQFVKHTGAAKHSKARHKKIRYIPVLFKINEKTLRLYKYYFKKC